MKILMVLNSPQVEADDVAGNAADRAILAVDGGVSPVLAAGLNPRWLLGDLDSAKAQDVQRAKAGGADIIPFPAEKDFTDLELALDLVWRVQGNNLRVLGLWGGERVDHQLVNFALLGRAAEQGMVISAPGRGQTFYFTRNSQVLLASRGRHFSLLALGGAARVEIIGAKYSGPVELEPGTGFGLGNEMVGSKALIFLRAGTLAIAQWGE